MPILQRDQAPPPEYYAEKLLLVLSGVEQQYSDLLLPAERELVATVRALSSDGQRLLARLLGRKGPLYRIDSLVYPELGSPDNAVAELRSTGLAMDPRLPADLQLSHLRLAEISALFPRFGRARKAALIDRIAARYPESLIQGRIASRYPLIELAVADLLTRFQLLYFGGTRDLSTFVLEDLGVVRFEAYALDPRHRQFPDRASFDRYLSQTQLAERISALEDGWNAELAADIAHDLGIGESVRLLERRRTRLLNRLGRVAERRGDHDLALGCYVRAGRPPARERRVRILSQRGDHVEAARLLMEMRMRPQSATESKFASSFGGRRARWTRSPPECHLRLPREPVQGVERAALAALLRNGGAGRHLENQLPLGMLGLAFWDIVFGPVEGAFVNPYQDRPLDLFWSDFRAARRDAIETSLAALRRPGVLAAAVRRTWFRKHGISNALVSWSAFDDAWLDRLLEGVPVDHWHALFDRMLEDLGETRTGFPDLTVVYGRNRYEWIEVKGPGDQLRPEQRVWFDFFSVAGIPARVLRVIW